MANGQLVPHGSQANAHQAAYHFTAGKIFSGGDDCAVVDWTSPQSTSAREYLIRPGAMVWVRMLDEVKLPDDICAVWWQTNSMSRKGIMLINMSIVDPGYSGYLTCLLVNFGKQVVVIDPTTIVAKLAFFQTDVAVAQPLPALPSGNYDADVLQTAANGPKSFLQLDNLSTELGAKKKEILEDIARDAPKKLMGAYVWATLGLVLLALATSIIPRLQALIKPDLDQAVQDAIDKRVAGQLSMLPSDREKALNIRVEKLEKALADAQAAKPAPPQAKGSTGGT
jgi:deoxycytidine triphosphate deaminase